MLTKNQIQTMHFLEAFGDRFWIQTFDDNKQRKNSGASPELVRTWNVDLEGAEELLPELLALNQRGAGIYFCVNEVDGDVRSNNTVKSIRAAFLDLDGSPLQPVLPSQPDIVVQTSKEKYHCYWLVKPKEPADKVIFKNIQQGLAAKFHSDRSISDLARVMRIPGFYNMKSKPFLIRHSTDAGSFENCLVEMESRYAL